MISLRFPCLPLGCREPAAELVAEAAARGAQEAAGEPVPATGWTQQ